MSDLSLNQLSLVDSDPDEGFDRFTRMASQLLGVPVALVSIVETERDRQYFTSARGLGEPWASRRQTPLSHSFCKHVKASNEVLRIEDARFDPVLKDNRAIPDLGVIAYLGIPIHAPDNSAIGALCAIDIEPRAWSDAEVSILSDLAAAVTDQIKLRAALYKSEHSTRASAYLGKIVENSRNEVFTFSPATLKFLTVNRGARENLGYSLKEVQELTPVDIKPEYSQAEFEALTLPLRSGAVSMLEFETVHLRKDGSTYPVSIRLELFRTERRETFVAFCEDITERLALEKNLKENTENFTALFNNAPDPITIADSDTTILLANPAFEQLLGMDASSLLGSKFIDTVPLEYKDDILTNIAQATEDDPISTIVQRHGGNGQERILMWSNIVQFHGGKPSKIFSIANDVTDIHEARLIAEQSAIEAEKAVEIRKTFLANMSHEVRTPLNAIMGLFQLIQSADVPERQKKQAEVGLNASHHLLSQLVNVLEISRMEAGSVEIVQRSIEVRPLAEQWVETATASNHRLGKSIEVSLTVEDDVPEHWTLDVRRVTQIVNNLTDNALKFTNEGHVQIHLRSVPMGSDRGAAGLEVRVLDTGCGIPESQRDTIFQRFIQVDGAETRENGGSGLGLAICHELAALMASTLSVEEAPADSCYSTIFTLRLIDCNQLECHEPVSYEENIVD